MRRVYSLSDGYSLDIPSDSILKLEMSSPETLSPSAPTPRPRGPMTELRRRSWISSEIISRFLRAVLYSPLAWDSLACRSSTFFFRFWRGDDQRERDEGHEDWESIFILKAKLKQIIDWKHDSVHWWLEDDHTYTLIHDCVTWKLRCGQMDDCFSTNTSRLFLLFHCVVIVSVYNAAATLEFPSLGSIKSVCPSIDPVVQRVSDKLCCRDIFL